MAQKSIRVRVKLSIDARTLNTQNKFCLAFFLFLVLFKTHVYLTDQT